MKRAKVLSLIFISLLLLGGCSPQTTSTTSEDLGSIILARAKIWVDVHVSYGGLNSWHGNPPYYQGYKTDCSGFVSYAWGLAAPGIGTQEFVGDGYATVVSIPELQPGDALNNNQKEDYGHIVLFVRWLDKANHTFDSYDLNTYPGYAYERIYTLVQVPHTNDWTISELEPYAQGPYQAQRLIPAQSSLVLGPGDAQSPMSSTIVSGNFPSPIIQYQVVGDSSNEYTGLFVVFVDSKNNNDRSGLQSIGRYLCNGKNCIIYFSDNLYQATRIANNQVFSCSFPSIIACYIFGNDEELILCNLGECPDWRVMVGTWQEQSSSTIYVIALDNEEYVVTSVSHEGLTYPIISQSFTKNDLTWSYFDSTLNLTVTITASPYDTDTLIADLSYSDGSTFGSDLSRVR